MIEYVLLLVIAVSVAVLFTRLMVGRTEGDEGFVIHAWQSMNQQIGKDNSDDIKVKKN